MIEAKAADKLEKKVYSVPEIDKEIVRLKLEVMGVRIDALVAEQTPYLNSWEEGIELMDSNQRISKASWIRVR